MLFFSNVFSLMDWSDDGVNNCTLMYLRNIEMARFSANKLQGPEITLVLRFNQFSSHDYGYGVGWDFNFTRIESETDQGEQSGRWSCLMAAGTGLTVKRQRRLH